MAVAPRGGTLPGSTDSLERKGESAKPPSHDNTELCITDSTREHLDKPKTVRAHRVTGGLGLRRGGGVGGRGLRANGHAGTSWVMEIGCSFPPGVLVHCVCPSEPIELNVLLCVYTYVDLTHTQAHTHVHSSSVFLSNGLYFTFLD